MSRPFFLFDTHVHLDHDPLHRDLRTLVEKARGGGVAGFLVPGVTRDGWPFLLETVSATPGALAAPGIHPLAAQQWNENTAAELESLLDRPEVVAIGEIGLDRLLEKPSLSLQEDAFRDQVQLARKARLPILVHCRKATGQMLRILREEKAEEVGGILHAFSGSVETAMQVIDLGFAIGFGGPLTYPNARRAPETLAALPEKWVVLETDAPDLAPHPHRGQTNLPEWLRLVAEKVSDIRGWTLEETAHITTANAYRILNLTAQGEKIDG